jgi:hypothetical protein
MNLNKILGAATVTAAKIDLTCMFFVFSSENPQNVSHF